MSRLNTLTDGDTTEFKRVLGEHITAEDAKKLMRHPAIVAAMAKTMREQSVFRLVHGRFHTLDEKIEMVKAWPGISSRFTEADFTRAVEEARDSGLLGRFEAASPKMPLLDIVVVPYLGSVVETFLYGRGRLRDAFGKEFVQREVYEMYDFNKRLELLDGIKPVTNCLKIEVVDLGAHWNRVDGFSPKETRSAKSAHAQVLFAGAEDTDWVRQMNPDQSVPPALMGGYVLWTPVCDDGLCLPYLWFDHLNGKAGLGSGWSDRYQAFSHPVVWE